MAYNQEYPYLNPNRENSDWLLAEIKRVTEEWIQVEHDWGTMQEAFNSLKAFINDYFKNLDVQDEINQKLEEMTKNGELANLVIPIVQSVFSPLFVNSESEMNDISKIYILASTGEIYYYRDGWINSGVVYGNSPYGIKIYPTMITKDNFNTLLPDLNNCDSNTIYNMYWLQNPEFPSNMPILNSGAYTIYNYNTSPNKTAGDIQYIQFKSVTGADVLRQFERIYGGGGNWGEWTELIEDAPLIHKTFHTIVNNNNYGTQLQDANAALPNKSYQIYIVDPAKIPENLPLGNTKGNYVLCSFNSGSVWMANDNQLCIYTNMADNYTLKFFSRICTSSAPAFSPWVELDIDNLIRVNSDNYQNTIPDLNTSAVHTNYIINVGTSGQCPDNMPNTSAGLYYLININQKDTWSESDMQIVLRIPMKIPQSTFNIYMRLAGSATVFSEWATIGGSSGGKGGVAGTTEHFRVITNNIMYERSTNFNVPNYNPNNNSTDCSISFPSSYLPDKKNKWCLVFHGAGRPISEWLSNATYNNIHTALLNAGFCVVLFNGFSDVVYDSWGSYKTTFSANKVVETAKQLYSLTDEYVAYGFSMGGMGLINFIRNRGSGCKAVSIGSPVISLKKVFDNNPEVLEPVYGFNGVYSEDKCTGCDPEKGLITIENETFYNGSLPPIYAFYGNEETSGYLDYRDCEAMCTAMSKSGLCVYFRTYPGGHEVCYGGNSDAIRQLVQFLSGF